VRDAIEYDRILTDLSLAGLGRVCWPDHSEERPIVGVLTSLGFEGVGELLADTNPIADVAADPAATWDALQGPVPDQPEQEALVIMVNSARSLAEQLKVERPPVIPPCARCGHVGHELADCPKRCPKCNKV
jgi:hypothetical protein